MTPRVLIIDDDQKWCRLLKEYLEPLGYEVEAAYDGPAGLAAALDGNHAVVILDVMLPAMNGFDVLRELRKTSAVPVLMLTALGDEVDRISGLEIGADDYLPKTFSTRELLARLRAVLRRSMGTVRSATEGAVAPISVGDLWIDQTTRSVSMAAQAVTLTAAEFDLLLALARHPGRVKTREQLLLEAADRDFEAFDRSIDVHISALRRKLGDDPKAPRFIETVRGVGYRIRRPGQPA
jgi:two-component system response regulator CpxR